METHPPIISLPSPNTSLSIPALPPSKNVLSFIVTEYEKTKFTIKISFNHQYYHYTITPQKLETFLLSWANLRFILLPHKSDIKCKSAIQDIFQFLSSRHDILINSLSSAFFNFHSLTNQTLFNEHLQALIIEPLYRFTLNNNTLSRDDAPYPDNFFDFNASDAVYDTKSGWLILSFEDRSLLSSIGRFWSWIDKDILGCVAIFQRLFDKANKPYFSKITFKNFDTRVSKLKVNEITNHILVGLDNGVIQVFNISLFPPQQGELPNNKIIINEGKQFKFLNQRISSICFFQNSLTLFSSIDNKIAIINNDYNTSSYVLKTLSLKNRLKGKGYISNLDTKDNKMFVVTSTFIILIYTIWGRDGEVWVIFNNCIQCEERISSFGVFGGRWMIGHRDKIMCVDTEDEGALSNWCKLDAGEKEKKYNDIGYNNSITVFTYFSNMRLFAFGLNNGGVVVVQKDGGVGRVIFAKKISDYEIINMQLWEGNYVLIVSDGKGGTFFFRIGPEEG